MERTIGAEEGNNAQIGGVGAGSFTGGKIGAEEVRGIESVVQALGGGNGQEGERMDVD